MHICILQSGEINPSIADNLPSYQDMYSALFTAANPSVNITYIQVLDDIFPTDIDAFDAFVITGSPSGAYDDDPWIITLHDLIRTIYAAGKPMIGICFGHQIIANALGGKAEKFSGGWGVGIRTSKIISSSDIFPQHHVSFDLLYMHQDQVITLPEGAETLMSDDFCQIAAFHIGKQVLCFQGHPEFTNEVVGAIINHREDSIGKSTAEDGRRSLAGQHDGAVIGNVITNFLANAVR